MSVGAVVLSFDLEFAWGSRQSSHDDAYAAGLERTQEVCFALLEILAKHRISATWATVGHLMLREEDCPGGRYPYDLPSPEHPWFDGEWYDGIPAFGAEGADRYYAPQVIEAIINCPVYQEIGSHTFSHANVGAAGCSEKVARAEFAECQKIAERWGRKLTSAVFPRNIVGHLSALHAAGYQCYRATNSEWYWFGHPVEIYERKWLRNPVWALRYLDERLGLCPPLPPVRLHEGLWEIPHSMFLPGFRGVSKYVTAEQRWRRAARGMRRAAERGRVFSLFTHPENFLPEPERLLPVFEHICQEAARLREKGEIEVLTMEGVAKELDAGRNLHWMGSA